MDPPPLPFVPEPVPGPGPARLHRRASSRGAWESHGRSLRIACLVWAGLWSVGLLMNNVVGPILSPDEPLDDAWPFPANPVAFLCIALSLGLFAYAGRPRGRPERLLDFALTYEVLLAAGIGLVNQWTPNSAGLSWICVVILVHPLIVPAPPAKTLLASLAAASMDLVGLAVTGARGVVLPPFAVILWTYLPNFLCAFLAVIPSQIRVRLERARAEVHELGSYQLREMLSRGGMGEVYRAEHRMLARPAAVKIVSPELLGAVDGKSQNTLLRRFEREARATAALCSPHTVHVYDYGVSEEGAFYYVMELLEGFDLEQLVSRFGPVLPERTVRILLQVCDSLGEAHENHLIHRDVKPSNICLCRYGRHVDFVKVLDFGLVQSTETDGRDPSITGESLPGTPAFMAPEQILGRSEVDPRTDLYALGCVAYWLLTGHLVFEGRTPLEVLARHARETPPAPSRLSELEIPGWLDEAILSCLEKEPDRRPSSADDLAERLGKCEFPRPWTGERARTWWERHADRLLVQKPPPLTSIGGTPRFVR